MASTSDFSNSGIVLIVVIGGVVVLIFIVVIVVYVCCCRKEPPPKRRQANTGNPTILNANTQAAPQEQGEMTQMGGGGNLVVSPSVGSVRIESLNSSRRDSEPNYSDVSGAYAQSPDRRHTTRQNHEPTP